MVHLFKFQNDTLAFDSESGALHKLDDLSAAVIESYIEHEGQHPGETAIQQLEAVWARMSGNAATTIDELIARGDLFAPAKSITPDQLYPDQPRIKSMCLHICHDCNLRCEYVLPAREISGLDTAPCWMSKPAAKRSIS